jgi:hypothetical protein
MLTMILAIVAVYIAIGIAIVVAVNYGYVQRGSRLRSIGEALPLVSAWPVVLFVLWALRP